MTKGKLILLIAIILCSHNIQSIKSVLQFRCIVPRKFEMKLQLYVNRTETLHL